MQAIEYFKEHVFYKKQKIKGMQVNKIDCKMSFASNRLQDVRFKFIIESMHTIEIVELILFDEWICFVTS